MKVVGYFLFACVLLSLLQTALSVLVVVDLIAVAFGIFYHPAETFGFLAFGLLANLFQTHPIAAVWLVSLFFMAGIAISTMEKGKTCPTQAPSRSPEGQKGDADQTD